jgi:putative phosphoribosyl transferase
MKGNVMQFRHRQDAGQQLTEALLHYSQRPETLVLALPRGGVPVAYEVARTLKLPLDVFIVRKLGVPGHEELAMGAIATGGVRLLNREVVQGWHIPQDVIDHITHIEHEELRRREELYRAGRPPINVKGCSVILIDDGLATGATMYAAIIALRQQQPARIVVAVPVAVREICDEFGKQVDEVICLESPEPFRAVGLWYEDFSQTTDDEVRELLSQNSRDQASTGKI